MSKSQSKTKTKESHKKISFDDIRSRYFEFFKKRGHVVVPSASLVPENDPTTLFTGSGMQPLIPYLVDQPHPMGKRLCNSQKSFRAEDIMEVGDNRHTTFFEMLGNWSLGDYFKQEQLSWFFEFLTDELKLDPEKLYVSVFSGGEQNKIPKDEESISIWKKLFAKKGLNAKAVDLVTAEAGSKLGMQGGRIFSYDAKKNWWSRAGGLESMPPGEIGGPDSEVFYEFTSVEHDVKYGEKCHPNCDCGRFLEIGNSVFMEYKKSANGKFEKLKQRNVDFGGGLERIAAAMADDADVFRNDVFQALFGDIRIRHGWNYDDVSEKEKRAMRIVADHMRAAAFIIGDGVIPSNKEQGYILRRLIRRAILNAHEFNSQTSDLYVLLESITSAYKISYPELFAKTGDIMEVFKAEEEKFKETLEKGMKELQKEISSLALLGTGKLGTMKLSKKLFSGKTAFLLYQSYGFPIEETEEILKEKNIEVDLEEFQKELKKHQELSRTAAAGRFKGGLADASVLTTRLHTAHHLLLAALREILGNHVHQRGSNITSERLRMDFSHPAKVTLEELKKVEDLVNQKIKENLDMVRKEMSKGEAIKIGAEMEFGVKYGDVVSVYFVQDKKGNVFSGEFCGGPHVKSTRELGTFKIVKEESIASGIRRIRGILI